MTSSRIETLAWAERTGGILSRRERVSLLGDAMRLQMRILAAQRRALLGRTDSRAFGVDPDRLRIPDTMIAREADANCQHLNLQVRPEHGIEAHLLQAGPVSMLSASAIGRWLRPPFRPCSRAIPASASRNRSAGPCAPKPTSTTPRESTSCFATCSSEPGLTALRTTTDAEVLKAGSCPGNITSLGMGLKHGGSVPSDRVRVSVEGWRRAFGARTREVGLSTLSWDWERARITACPSPF